LGNARLPEVYRGAKVAISECVIIDECKDWADKAEALASYARQAGDEELRKMADRIQARAIKRYGDLLKEIESQSKANLKQNRGFGTGPSVTRTESAKPSTGIPDSHAKAATNTGAPISRTEAARSAGLSERQQKTAIRVSNVPEKEFEEADESKKPPSGYGAGGIRHTQKATCESWGHHSKTISRGDGPYRVNPPSQALILRRLSS
jgi:hypothetical protein